MVCNLQRLYVMKPGAKDDFRGFGAEFQMLTAEHNEKIRKIMTLNPGVKRKELQRQKSLYHRSFWLTKIRYRE